MSELLPDKIYAWNYVGCFNTGLGLPVVDMGDTPWSEYIRADLATLNTEAAHDMIRYLLPLAKGYVHANPGVRSTECIIEDAEAMIAAKKG